MSSDGKCHGEKPSNMRRRGCEVGRGAVINKVGLSRKASLRVGCLSKGLSEARE